jgi:molecular chaperone DnaJ
MPVLQGFRRGDHRVLVNVAVPRHLSEEQRRMLEEFERQSTAANYRADEGFFEKLKSAFR